MYNHKPTGHGDHYHNLTGLHLFPFWLRLNYKSFEYGDLKLDKNEILAGESAMLRCKIKRCGKLAGDGVVQLYIRDMIAIVARPVIRKGFKRIHLDPGEIKEVIFPIDPAILTMFNESLKSVLEPGTFVLW